MKTIGIIAEYNPFHSGHEYQISYARGALNADYVVVAMSGDFVQRGAPAVLGKALRAEMALRCGADLVLETPASVCTASAEGFAFGAVSLLDGLGVVDELCFGCESRDSGIFMRLAQILAAEPPSYRKHLQEALRQGMSFPVARTASLIGWLQENDALPTVGNIHFGGTENPGSEKTEFEKPSRDTPSLQPPEQALREFLSLPNNILALEYCKAIIRQNSRMHPAALRRMGSGYHESEFFSGTLPSASALRRILRDARNGLRGRPEPCKADPAPDLKKSGSLSGLFPEGTVPGAILPLFADALRSGGLIFAEDFNPLFPYCLLRETPESLARYSGISGSLAQRIYRHRFEFRDFDQFGELLKTREITRTRIDRGLFHMLLGIRNTPAAVPYARVLGFRRESAALLSAIKKQGRIPLLTKPSSAARILPPEALATLEETVFASNLYQSVLSQITGEPFIHEYSRPLVIF